MTRATQDQEQLSRFTGSRNPQPKDVLGAEMEPAWAGLVALECYTTLPLQHRIQLYSGVPVRVTKGPVAERRVDTFRPTPTPASMNGATPSRMPSQCRGRICHPSSSDPPSLTNLQRNNHNPGWPVRQQQFVPPPPPPPHHHSSTNTPKSAASSGSSYARSTESARTATSRTLRPRAVTAKTSSTTRATTPATSRAPSSSTSSPASSTPSRRAPTRTSTTPRTFTSARMASAPATTGATATRRASSCTRRSWR